MHNTATLRRRGTRLATPLLSLFLLVGLARFNPAEAFDTQPHFDITRDALASEGFGDTAIGVVQVSNWFNDLYENSSKNPYSGHAPWYLEVIGRSYGSREGWSQPLIKAAARAHFDSDSGLKDTLSIEREWNRLALATRAALLNQAAAGDVEGILAVAGSSLHMVQDFYTHSNWVEPKYNDNYARSGPGWATQRTFGSHPTWFDVPAASRNGHRLYCTGTREHGSWKSDNNQNLGSLNKDWAGRPLHRDAYISSYVASRQWVRAMRVWLGNDALWNRVLSFNRRHGRDLDHDLKGAFEMSYYAGHWNGNGEPRLAADPGPGGALFDLRRVTRNYFESGSLTGLGSKKSAFRQKWEAMILLLDARNPPTAPIPVASSLELRNGVEFVVAQITKIKEVDDRDLGSLDEAEWYGKATIAGQEFRSGLINGHDDFNFLKNPAGPFTYIKAVPAGSTSVRVLLRLYDEDDSIVPNKDDHCDISPVRGRKDLRLRFNPSNRTFRGDLSGTRSATVRGRGDDDTAEITFRLETLRLTPPPAPPSRRVTVTFQSLRLIDPTRPNRRGKVIFRASEGGGASGRYPASGTQNLTLNSSQSLPEGFTFTAAPSGDDPVTLSASLIDEGRLITTIIRDPEINGGKPLRTTEPLTLSLNRTLTAADGYGGPSQTFTARSSSVGRAYFEVIYSVVVTRIFRPPGINDTVLGTVGTLEPPPRRPPTRQPPTRQPTRPFGVFPRKPISGAARAVER